jgi:UDP-2-acetamido-3-amino-2,3-dideoxy-glucuronate N-acetyltransferase
MKSYGIFNYVSSKASVHESTKIWRFSQVLDYATIGKNCVIGSNCSIDKNVVIGNNVRIQNGCNLFDGLIIEDDVFIGPGVTFTNVKNPRAFISRKEEYKSTIVRQGATIGAGCVIVCGIEIGKYALIGAGSTLTKSVKEHEVYFGNPAKFRGTICKCGDLITNGLYIKYCSKCKGEQ